MSRPLGGYIGHRPVPASSDANSAAVGMWTLREAQRFKQAGTWPLSSGADAFFSSVALLLHMNGTGATFVDSSGTPKTITAGGSVTQSTDESKFGGKSAYFSTSSDSLSFADLGIGTGDFAIELFLKSDSSVQYAQIIGNESAGSATGFSLLINNNSAGGGQIALYRGGSIVSSSIFTDFTDDAWHHIAVSRSGTTVRLYVDGTLLSTATSSANFTSSANTFVARNNIFSPRNVVGYIDELRITVGNARGYTGSTITVPTAAFPDA